MKVLCYACHKQSGTPLFEIDIILKLWICPECDVSIENSCEQLKKLVGAIYDRN